MKNNNRQKGFSLIELMVGMGVGLIMLAAVIALTVSILRTNADSVTVARLTQEGRAIGDLFSRELRRARYSGNYLAFVGSEGAVANNFESINIPSGDCIIFGYDADDDGAVDTNEIKVFTLRNEAVYFAQYATYVAANCNDANALRISSPDVQVTDLLFARDTGANPNPNRIDVSFRLALTGTAEVTRRFDQAIQVRNPFL